MRARYINEKFSEEGDPIHDMGIGLYVHKNFDSDGEMHKFLADNIEAIMKINVLPRKFITYFAKGDQCKMESDDYNKIAAYVKKYCTVLDLPQTRLNPVSISSLQKYLQSGVYYAQSIEDFKNIYILEKFTEGGDPIRDMGIGVFVQKKYTEAAFAARKIYINLEAILGMDNIPDDIIYPIGYEDPKTGVKLSYNPVYLKKITDYIHKYVINDTYFKSDVLRELHKILLIARYPK